MGRFFSIGEALIDYFKDGDSLIPKAGGAPANVAVCLSKLGKESYFVGCLSNDDNGKFLYDTLSEYGVKLDYVQRVDNPTAYSKVELVKGDRRFSFSRKDTADLMLDKNLINLDLTKDDVVHFCSVSLVESKTKESHIKILEDCINNNTLVSYDVNLRPALWKDKKEMKDTAIEFIKYADIVKFSIEELKDLFNTENPSVVFDRFSKVKIILVTLGEKGSMCYSKELGFKNDHVAKKVVDTTGAGDCYIGSFLYSYTKWDRKEDFESLYGMTDFASNACKFEVSKMGAMESMPTLAEVQNEMFK